MPIRLITMPALLGFLGLWSMLTPAAATASVDWREVPDDSAALILFRAQDRTRGRIGYWSARPLGACGFSPIQQRVEALSRAERAVTGSQPELQPLQAAAPLRLLLCPGRYAIEVTTSRGEIHRDLLQLQPGELTILHLNAEPNPPFLRRETAETFAAHLAAQNRVAWRQRDVHGEQRTRRLEHHLGALAIEPPIDGHCHDGSRTLHWHNARLDAELIDCNWSRGRLSFDDGTTAELVFPDLRARSLISATRGMDERELREILAAYPDADASLLRQARYDSLPWPASAASAEVAIGGSPLGTLTAGVLLAVDGQPVVNLDQPALERLLRGAHGTTLEVSLQSLPPTAGRRVVELRRDLAVMDHPSLAPLFLAGPTAAEIVYGDGSRFQGHVAWSSADDGILPHPRPEGLGRRILADGSEQLGTFNDGTAEGWLWCVDAHGEGPCEFANDQRLTETGAVQRSRTEILASEPGFSRSMTIDLLRRKHIEALLTERWGDFLQLDADLTVLGEDTGVEALFYVARALAATGRPAVAEQRAMAYLNLAGSEGAAYGEALSLVAALRPLAAEARAEHERRIDALRSQLDGL